MMVTNCGNLLLSIPTMASRHSGFTCLLGHGLGTFVKASAIVEYVLSTCYFCFRLASSSSNPIIQALSVTCPRLLQADVLCLNLLVYGITA